MKLVQQFHRIALYEDRTIGARHAFVDLRDLPQEFRLRFSVAGSRGIIAQRGSRSSTPFTPAQNPSPYHEKIVAQIRSGIRD
jgi:hypothetical protein